MKEKKGIYIKGKDIEIVKTGLLMYSDFLHKKYEKAFEEKSLKESNESDLILIAKIIDILEDVEEKQGLKKPTFAFKPNNEKDMSYVAEYNYSNKEVDEAAAKKSQKTINELNQKE